MPRIRYHKISAARSRPSGNKTLAAVPAPSEHKSFVFLTPIKQWVLFSLTMAWVVRNTILIRGRPGEQYSSVDSLAVIQIFIIAAILLLLLTGPLSRLWHEIKHSSLKYYFLYYGLAVLSALWSSNPAFSMYRALEVISLSFAVLAFCLNSIDVEINIKRIQLIGWSVLLISTLGSIFLRGLTWNLRNNDTGASAAMIACYLGALMLTGRRNNNRKHIILFGFACLLLLMSMSLASWWSFWFGIFYCGLLTKRKGLIILLVLLGSGLFFSLGTDTRQNLLIRDKNIEDIEQLTGRKLLWENYASASRERPLLGFGFSMGAREVGNIYTTNTHNVFFAILLGVGLTGVFVFGLFFFSLIRELLRYKYNRNPVWLACTAALATGYFNSTAISILGEQWAPSTTVFLSFLGMHLVFLRKEKRMPSSVMSQKPKINRLLHRVS